MVDTKYWWQRAKIYELYIDKFAGNIKELTHNIDFFGILGVDTLHILPHYPSPMVDDGYDISDYRGVREDLGTLEDFKNFLEVARAKNIRVILDLVLNHTSDQHPWFIEARSSKDNPKRNYYLWSEDGKNMTEAQNMFPMIKPHNWIPNEATKDFYFATFYPAQPDLNWDNDEVFEEMLSIMEYWAAMGVSGFRIDAAGHIIKRDGSKSMDLPEAHAVLKRIRARLEEKYPEVILLAETSAGTKEYFGNGDECHMVYAFPLMRQLWWELLIGNAPRLQSLQIEMADIPENCAWGTFLRNHDELSLGYLSDEERAALVEKIDPAGKYMFGNYPSSRVAEVFNGDQEKILNAFKLLYSVPGSPIMYYGDEIGMKNLEIVQGIQDARKYVRGDFDWKEASKQMKDPTSLFNKTAAILHGQPAPEVAPIIATPESI